MRPRPSRQEAAAQSHRQMQADLNAILRTARAAIRAYREADDEADEDDEDDDPLRTIF